MWRPQVALDGAGLVWVVWSQQVEGNFDLYARALDEEGQLWLPPVRLSTHLNPDINHHLVADGEGHLWVVWQGFHKTNSDIFLRHYDGQDRVWVAWDEAGPNWGKDTGLTTHPRWPEEGQAAWDAWVDQPSRPGTRLYEYRKVNLLVLEGERRKVPLHDLRQALKKAEVEVHDYPQLFIDPDSGRVALLFHQTQEDGHVAWGSPIWVTRQP